jgi:hypothetical protein
MPFREVIRKEFLFVTVNFSADTSAKVANGSRLTLRPTVSPVQCIPCGVFLTENRPPVSVEELEHVAWAEAQVQACVCIKHCCASLARTTDTDGVRVYD